MSTAPAASSRGLRRGVELEITLALPYGSAIESSGRVLDGPTSLGLPSPSAGDNRWIGGRSAQPAERALGVRGGGIRLRVIGGNAQPAPYAPLGRW